MFKAMPRAATRESSPTIKPRPPKNSAAIARIANNAGICMVFVKKPMVPLKPSPPNQPNIFCAPCAKNTTPSANRRIAVAASFSVEMSFLNIVPPVLSLLLYAPFHEDCCRSPRSAGGNREHREAAPKAVAPQAIGCAAVSTDNVRRRDGCDVKVYLLHRARRLGDGRKERP